MLAFLCERERNHKNWDEDHHLLRTVAARSRDLRPALGLEGSTANDGERIQKQRDVVRADSDQPHSEDGLKRRPGR